MSGVPIARRSSPPTRWPAASPRCAGLCLAFQTSSGNADRPGRRLHAELDRRRGDRRHLAARRLRRRHRLDLRRLHPAHDRRPAVRLRPAAALQPLFEGSSCSSRSASAPSASCASGTGSSCSDERHAAAPPQHRRRPRSPVAHRLRLHRRAAADRQPLLDANFLSPDYLLQQLRIGVFLGIVAAGMMMVILLGHIDLSVPWTLTVGGMMATAVGGWWGADRRALAIPSAWPRPVSASSTASASPTCASRR